MGARGAAAGVAIAIAVVAIVACSRESGEQPSAIGPATKDYADAGDGAVAPLPTPTSAPTPTSTPSDVAAAEALFQEAKKLMMDGKWTEACPKLEESDRLDPADGTMLNLASCYEHLGDATKACATYAEALKRLRAKAPVNEAREKFVVEHMGALKCPP